MNIFFKSAEHKRRFIAAMQQTGKIYDGKLDPEYASALYILTADLWIWEKASEYVSRDGIRIADLLEEVVLSSGETALVQLAGNLFNGNTRVDPVEFVNLDESNFRVALTALQVRRQSIHETDAQNASTMITVTIARTDYTPVLNAIQAHSKDLKWVASQIAATSGLPHPNMSRLEIEGTREEIEQVEWWCYSALHHNQIFSFRLSEPVRTLGALPPTQGN